MIGMSSSRNGRPRAFHYTSGSAASLIRLVSQLRCCKSSPGIRVHLHLSTDSNSTLSPSKSCRMRSPNHRRKVLTSRSCISRVALGTTRNIASRNQKSCNLRCRYLLCTSSRFWRERSRHWIPTSVQRTIIQSDRDLSPRTHSCLMWTLSQEKRQQTSGFSEEQHCWCL